LTPQTKPDGHRIVTDGRGQVATGTDGCTHAETGTVGHKVISDGRGHVLIWSVGHWTVTDGRGHAWTVSVGQRTTSDGCGHERIGTERRGQARLMAASASMHPNP
jgi:hypothetical protein